MSTQLTSAPSTRIPRYPTGSYFLRVKAEPKFEISKNSGNRMLVFNLEMIGDVNRNPIISVDGGDYEVSGEEFKSYMLVEQGKTFTFERFLRSCCLVAKQDDLLPKLGEIAFGAEDGMPYRADGTPIKFAGLECLAEIRTKHEDRKDDNGNPLINPITGKAKTFTKHEIGGFDTD